jgi:hypothetical protein
MANRTLLNNSDIDAPPLADYVTKQTGYDSRLIKLEGLMLVLSPEKGLIDSGQGFCRIRNVETI